jgi:hypothetical protein
MKALRVVFPYASRCNFAGVYNALADSINFLQLAQAAKFTLRFLNSSTFGVNSAQLIPGGGLLFVQNMAKNIAIAIFFANFVGK